MGKLSASQLRTIKQPGRYGDGGGLLLNVKPSGAKSWLLRLQANGKRRDYGLGSLSQVSLADARKRAADYRKLLDAGIDPLTDRGRERIATLREVPTHPWDDRDELRRTRRAAGRGCAVAQSNLGFMHFRGAGVRQDYAEAERWFRLAAEQGNADAQHNLGGLHASGTIVAKDYVEAERWFRLAAAQGHAGAQTNLGAMYANGIGVVQDDAEAERWFRLAAAQGNAEAQYNLGAMYCGRSGAAKDYATAVKWYGLAASQGHTDAQYVLGAMYGNGTGVAQDYVQAHMWFNLAAISGNGESMRNRDVVAGKMTASQIAEAQMLARKCQQAYAQPGD
jgi:TPR repeat protein